ncbi:MAG: hypothetical protein GX811_03885 [Lentisphaerae bacterium]|nr:hypothetical protein [Lentisphaerota bacterium]
MKIRYLTGICLTTLILTSAVYSGTGSLVVIASSGQGNVAAGITRKADFVACSVSLSSDKKTPEEKFTDIQATIKMITNAARQNPKILVHSGPVTLSGDNASSFSAKSLIFSSWDSYSVARLTILVPIKDGNPNIFGGGLIIKQFFDGIKFPDKTKCVLSQIYLAVENPEQYRQEVLKAIADSIGQVKEALGKDIDFQLTGLANPVTVQQIDDENVNLFINYALSVSTD